MFYMLRMVLQDIQGNVQSTITTRAQHATKINGQRRKDFKMVDSAKILGLKLSIKLKWNNHKIITDTIQCFCYGYCRLNFILHNY